MKSTMFLPLLILITGCHIPHYAWHKDGATPDQYQKDFADCQMQTMQLPPLPLPPPPPAPTSYTIQQYFPGTATIEPSNSRLDAVNAVNYQQRLNIAAQAEQNRKQEYFNACMQSKGWTLQRLPDQ